MPLVPTLSAGLPRAAASLLVPESAGAWSHSRVVEDPTGSTTARVGEGCPKAEGSKRQGRETRPLGIKAAFYIPVYFKDDGVTLFLAQILCCCNYRNTIGLTLTVKQ